MGTSISVSSAKGGVGKTTVSINLGIALAALGKETVLIDGSTTTPDVALRLGLPFYIRTLNDFINGNAEIGEVVFEHDSGLKIVPTSIHPEASLKWLDSSKINSVVQELKNSADFVILDSPAGMMSDAIDVLKSSDRLVVVTNPEIASVVNSQKTISAAKKLGVDVLGIIINRTNKIRGSLSQAKIKRIIGKGIPIIGVLPDHKSFSDAVIKSTSVVEKFPRSSITKEFKRIAKRVSKYSEKKK